MRWLVDICDLPRRFVVRLFPAIVLISDCSACIPQAPFHRNCVLSQLLIFIDQSLVFFQGVDQFEFDCAQFFRSEFVVQLILVYFPLHSVQTVLQELVLLLQRQVLVFECSHSIFECHGSFFRWQFTPQGLLAFDL